MDCDCVLFDCVRVQSARKHLRNCTTTHRPARLKRITRCHNSHPSPPTHTRRQKPPCLGYPPSTTQTHKPCKPASAQQSQRRRPKVPPQQPNATPVPPDPQRTPGPMPSPTRFDKGPHEGHPMCGLISNNTWCHGHGTCAMRPATMRPSMVFRKGPILFPANFPETEGSICNRTSIFPNALCT